jgi:hypothetical protein
MTSTLPDFSSSSSAAPAAADASSLAALFPAPTATDPVSGSTPEFAALMGAAPAPAAVTAPGSPAGLVSWASTSSRLRAAPALAAAGMPLLITVDPARPVSAAPVVASVDLAAVLVPVEETVWPAEPVQSLEITRDMLEEAAAFVASLLQTLLPGVPPPEFSAVAYQRSVPASAGPTGTPVALPAAVVPVPANATGGAPAAKAASGPHLFTLTAGGAIELKLDLAQFSPGELTPKMAAAASVEISAELQRSGEIAVRLEAVAALPGADLRSQAPASPLGREIFAGKFPAAQFAPESSAQPGERNFVFTGDKQVKPASPVDGISVAKTETTMPVAPIEEARSARHAEPFSVLPYRVDFQVVVPPAERITVPAAAPAAQNLAERAVETVTNLVDTQFSASLQKSGSVHLQLRFGGEDLSVRVEIKDGAVQTDFRTDSAELRTALAREWQVVAAQSPEQMRRYLEPVFSPNSSPAPVSDEAPSFSSRQQQQAQQDLPSRQSREAWHDPASPFSRRSQLSDSFIPEPAGARGPAFLPTSLRLSVLA